MTLRKVLGGVLLAVIAGSAGTAVAGGPSVPLGYKHQICVVTSNDPNHPRPDDYYCISWDAVQ